MYEDQTYDAIMERLLASIPDNMDKREGSFVWDALSPAALELAQAYQQLDLVLQFGFAQTTYGPYLDYRGQEHGVARLPATKATGQVTITGQDAVEVPEGTLFSTQSGVQFETVASVIIADGTATVNIEAVEAGKDGNVLAGTIIVIPVNIPGVTGVTNENQTAGGTEAESDTAFLDRILDKVRLPATSGNAYHYKQWAKEVPGVGDAQVTPLWDGPGTVKVVLLDANKQAPSQAIVNDVAKYIEELRPIGASVTVQAVEEVPININATLQIASYATLDEVKQLIMQGVTAYLESLAFKDPLVRYTRIAAVILDIPPIIDYSNLLINDGTANIEILPGQVAVLGTVTVDEQD